MKLFFILIFALLSACGVQQGSKLMDSGDSGVSPWSLKWFNATQPNTMYSSDDHMGAVYVLENYFQTCSYCNENAPNVDELATSYKDDARVQVLDIGVDKTARSYQLWVDQHNPNHPVLMDTSHTLSGELGTSGYPSTYVLDCDLKIQYSTTGVWESQTKKELKQAIDKLLAYSICRL